MGSSVNDVALGQVKRCLARFQQRQGLFRWCSTPGRHMELVPSGSQKVLVNLQLSRWKCQIRCERWLCTWNLARRALPAFLALARSLSFGRLRVVLLPLPAACCFFLARGLSATGAGPAIQWQARHSVSVKDHCATAVITLRWCPVHVVECTAHLGPGHAAGSQG